jgi:hypothetical protein
MIVSERIIIVSKSRPNFANAMLAVRCLFAGLEFFNFSFFAVNKFCLVH